MVGRVHTEHAIYADESPGPLQLSAQLGPVGCFLPQAQSTSPRAATAGTLALVTVPNFNIRSDLPFGALTCTPSRGRLTWHACGGI